MFKVFFNFEFSICDKNDVECHFRAKLMSKMVISAEKDVQRLFQL